MAGHGETQSQIVQLFSAKLQIEVPSIHSDLIVEGLLDSLTFVDLIMHLENEFGIEISVVDLEIDQFRSVQKIAEFVGGRTTTGGSAASESEEFQLETLDPDQSQSNSSAVTTDV